MYKATIHIARLVLLIYSLALSYICIPSLSLNLFAMWFHSSSYAKTTWMDKGCYHCICVWLVLKAPHYSIFVLLLHVIIISLPRRSTVARDIGKETTTSYCDDVDCKSCSSSIHRTTFATNYRS